MVRLHRSVGLLAVGWLLLACALPANALTLHYDQQRDPELLACDRMAEIGNSEEAKNCFDALLSHTDLLVRAEAARAVGDVKLANRTFREATDESNDPYIKARWGHLFLSTHQTSDAASLFRESLLIEPDNIPARIGLAAAQGRQFQGEARQTLYDIILNQPDTLHALILLAHIELELQRLDEARGLLEAAKNLAEEQDVSPLEIYALYASLDLLNGITDSEWTKAALALNPSYGDIYAIPAHFYIITYRYREAVELYQKSVDIEPNLSAGHSKLGINMLRVNNVFGARYHLEKAYQLDPYNTETVNTLRLLDDMDDMRISHVDVVDANGDALGRAIIRLDQDGADALEPYVQALSEKAMRTFTERYEFNLKKPMIVELYHNHDDFGVRTVSTPGVGLLGVTFGYVLAMDSPRARPTGQFHWGSTLWHEIAHVYTIEAANHLLPRWFSEGLSVYEEWHTGPLPGRELSLQVLQMLKDDRFLPVLNLDSGFVRPTYEGQVQVSYMQAGLLCTYIADKWEHSALVKLLKDFGRGVSPEDAIRKHLEIEPEQLDRDFISAMKQKYAYTLANFQQWSQLPRQIAGAINQRDWALADTLSRKLIEIYPDQVGEGNGYVVLAKALKEQSKLDESLDVLMRWHDRGGYEPQILRELAKDLSEQDRVEDAIKVLESINWVTPYQVDEHRQLGQHYLDRNEPELALREYDALLGSSADDTSNAWLGKSRAYLMLGRREQAKRSVLLALENAPFYREAQRVLLEINTGEKLD